MCAAQGNNVRVVEYLAEAVELLNGDATDSTGATALHHAASAGHPTMITALSNVPRIEINATDKVTNTIFHYFTPIFSRTCKITALDDAMIYNHYTVLSLSYFGNLYSFMPIDK